MNQVQFDYLRGLLESMAERKYPPFDVKNRDDLFLVNFSFKANRAKDQFEKDWKKYLDKKTTDDERKKIEERLESLAKTLPDVTKSTLSAITAFKSGDAFSGSAAIMDICASLTPLIAGLSAAGGPPGMLVGAIFSMIGQILSFFAPESESMTQKIEKLLKDLKAEETQQDIITVRQSIRVYTSSLRVAARSASKAMTEDKNPSDWIQTTDDIIKLLNPLEGSTVMLFREVMNWLNKPNNQTVDLWPTILSAACQAWADMMAAALTLLSFVHTDDVEDQYSDAKELADPKETVAVEQALKQLQRAVVVRLVVLKANNDILLEILEHLKPAAQNRGMFWMIGENTRLYAGTKIKEGKFSNLGGEGKSITVTAPLRDIGSPHPTYYQLGLESWGTPGYDRTYISEIKPPYESQNSKQLVDENGKDSAGLHSLSDVWIEPGDKPSTIWFYTAKGNEITGYRVEIDKDMSRAHPTGFSLSLKADVKSVRVLHSPEAFLEDPDNASGILTGIDYFAYGGLVRENSEIFVDVGKAKGYVRSPWGGYSGIGIDQHYLWVFGSAGFACATHASIARCLMKEIPQPRWIEHQPGYPLYTEGYNKNKDKVSEEVAARHPLKGLIDVSPCDDGTLVTALYTRSVEFVPPVSHVMSGHYSFADSNALYTAAYETDLEKGTIKVEWIKIEGSTGVRVRKIPVFCWSLFESLQLLLVRLAARLSFLSGETKGEV